MKKKKHSVLSNIINQFSINVDNLLNFPCYVFIKNKLGIYINYNNYGAANLGYGSGNEISGKSDLELFPRDIANIYRINDAEVITKRKQIFVPEKGVLKDNFPVTFMSYKIPLYNKNKTTIIGVAGLAFTQPVHDTSCPGEKILSVLDFAQLYNHGPNKINQSCLILSAKERLCVQCLYQGLTVKMTARQLNISPKTVETYIERAKIKMNCDNKTQLIVAFTENCMSF